MVRFVWSVRVATMSLVEAARSVPPTLRQLVLHSYTCTIIDAMKYECCVCCSHSTVDSLPALENNLHMSNFDGLNAPNYCM